MLERIHSSNPDAFATGGIVTIVGVIDGDELLIENQEGVPTRLRILGIKSFSPTLSDPLLSEYGKICFDYLKARVTHQSARLEIPGKILDTEGRLLGSLFLILGSLAAALVVTLSDLGQRFLVIIWIVVAVLTLYTGSMGALGAMFSVLRSGDPSNEPAEAAPE